MKKFLHRFFVVLGVLFLFQLIAVAIYFLSATSVFAPTDTESSSVDEAGAPTGQTSEASAGGHPLLNEAQEKALTTFGIDPAGIPSEITPAQEACFVEALGQVRVDEIVAGDTPSVTDYFKAKDCI